MHGNSAKPSKTDIQAHSLATLIYGVYTKKKTLIYGTFPIKSEMKLVNQLRCYAFIQWLRSNVYISSVCQLDSRYRSIVIGNYGTRIQTLWCFYYCAAPIRSIFLVSSLLSSHSEHNFHLSNKVATHFLVTFSRFHLWYYPIDRSYRA